MVKENELNTYVWDFNSGDKKPTYQTRKKATNKLTNLIPALQDGEVIYRVDMHNMGALGQRATDRYFVNVLTSYPKAFSFNQNSYTATDLGLGLGDKFDARILKAELDTDNNGPNDAKFHVEVVTDYASDNKTDWLAYGLWIQTPKEQTLKYNDYELGTFAIQNNIYGNGTVPNELTGTVTYKGGMLGLHTSLENNEVKLSHFTGKATFIANFGDASTLGNYSFEINELKLDGQSVSGQIAASTVPFVAQGILDAGLGSSRININGIKYTGRMLFVYTGPKTDNTTPPTGFTGQIKGTSEDGTKSFVTAYGAKKDE